MPEQLRKGTAKVRNVLGSEDSITDKDIQDSLWHYYYDVEKTVNYLLSMYHSYLIWNISNIAKIGETLNPRNRRRRSNRKR